MNDTTAREEEDMWHYELSADKIDKLDPEKLKFALEESRAYLENVSEKANRLSNKGFILMAIVSGIMTFVMSRSLAVLLDPASTLTYVLQHYWSVAILVLFCLACWLHVYYTLAGSVLRPIGYRPLGTFPKNLLRKGLFEMVSTNRLIVRQLECYQKVAEDNIEENRRIASCVRRCLLWAFVYPLLATFAWAIPSLIIALRPAAG